MIGGDRELDLKRLARAVGEKKLKMATYRPAEEWTGLQVGGISPLALLNRGFEVYIDRPATTLSHVYVSAGRRGINLRVPVEELIAITKAKVGRGHEGGGRGKMNTPSRCRAVVAYGSELSHSAEIITRRRFLN
ncbi:MAG: hypothetical protein DRH15_14965 [Deltaproteobacteria bacterium]|nr:MAG: hypothetical protein DRH15_14965 [Deltaproteobacteria bacterium]